MGRVISNPDFTIRILEAFVADLETSLGPDEVLTVGTLRAAVDATKAKLLAKKGPEIPVSTIPG